MRFTISAAAFLAFVSSALAQTADFDAITKPLKDEEIAAGSTYTIEWSSIPKYSGSVTLSLLGGVDPGTLVPLGSIGTADNSANKFAWAVDSALGDKKTYGIQITLDSDTSIFQYSNPFHIKGGSGSGNGTSSGTASGTATITISSKSSHSSSTPYPTITHSSNSTTTSSAGPTKVTLTTTTSGGSGGGSTTTPTTVPTAAAAHVAAGSLAMFGGLIAAVFAL